MIVSPGATPALRWGWSYLLPLLLVLGATPRLFHDQVGRQVQSGPVHRIVALAPDVTELAFAVGAGGQVVAAPAAADFPQQAARLPRVSPTDVEAIIAHRPDLVLASAAGNDPRVVERLVALGARTFTVDVTSIEKLIEACRLLGAVVGREREAGVLADEIAARARRATDLAEALPQRTALYVVWFDPLIVAAPGTFHDDVLRRARLINLAPTAAGRYPRVDQELLLDARLECVVAPDETEVRATYARVLGAAVGARFARGALQVIWVPADPANRPGPRLPVALEALVAARRASP